MLEATAVEILFGCGSQGSQCRYRAALPAASNNAAATNPIRSAPDRPLVATFCLDSEGASCVTVGEDEFSAPVCVCSNLSCSRSVSR